jgi:hypothetical protein
MTPADVLDRLAAAGVRARVHDGVVWLNPASLVSAELRDAVLANKPELVRTLSTWDEGHVRAAIAAALARIGASYTQDAPIGTTHGDQRLTDLWEAVNVAGQRRDRAGFDQALAELERHVVTTYGVRAGAVT